MITDRKTRVTTPTTQATPTPQPIERVVVDVPTKEFRERCPACGRLVAFTVTQTRDDKRYVRCPHCGNRAVISTTADTIRPVQSVR